MVFKIIGTPGRVCIKQAIQEANGNPCIRMVAHVMELDLESRDSENESLGSYDDDDDDDQQGDDERTKSDDDKSVDLNKTDDEEETQEDVFHRLKDAELIDEGKGDEEMTDAEKVNPELEEVNQEVASAQVQDEAQATTTADPAQVASSSRSVSSNYGSIFLNLDNISSVETKIISMLDVQVQHEVPIALKEFDQKRTLFETITKSKSFDRNPKHKALYHALMESILKDEDAMDKGVVDNKDAEPSKKVKSTDTSEGTTKSQPKSTGKFAQSKEIVFEAGDTQLPQKLGEDMGKTDEPPIVNADPKDCDLAKAEKPSKMLNELMSTPINFTAFAMNQLQISDLTKTYLVGPVYNLLKGTCKSYVELECNIEECYKTLNDQLDKNNPEGDRYTFDLNKPLPLVESRNHLIVLADYFFNNDLPYLQGGSTDRIYTTSLTKMKVAKHALLVINVKVNKWYGYGHLEEIEVRRSDQKLYKFMEGDFLRIHLNDIEDMLLLNWRDLPKDIPLDRIEVHRTSEGYLSIHNHDGNPSRSNIKQALRDEVLKIKNFKKYDYTSFQDQEKYEHVGPKVTSSQDGKRSQDDDKRLDLADDLKESQVHIQVKLKEQSQA
ncbi:hypothetical protein Tco_1093169 [Tanacetum coccineum]|uniref:Uncharacterized protein n=1 Tax=Tanacetum coccineum TaxID=301880 RepID=A0ABQ5IBY2_9ASTR